MHAIEHRHLKPVGLIAVAGAYALFNLISVGLCAYGVIHPPWDVLMFFIWMGPAAMVFGLFFYQFTAQRRFSWLAAALFILAVGIAVLINLHIYGLALAAV